MKAKLTKIYQRKASYNGDVDYFRCTFQLEDGSFAMTDLVRTFRNFAWWDPVMKSGVGTVIDGVILKETAPGKPKKINADSQVRIIQATLFKPQEEKLL